jgi:hypothetical protein
VLKREGGAGDSDSGPGDDQQTEKTGRTSEHAWQMAADWGAFWTGPRRDKHRPAPKHRRHTFF